MNSTLRPTSIHGAQITVQQMGEETLLYDARTHQAWCLNRSSACVWGLCDGGNTVAEIAAAATRELGAPFGEELVLVTLAELREKGLLEAAEDALPQGVSRREMIARVGLTAAALLPVIAALTTLPASAQTVSAGSGGNS